MRLFVTCACLGVDLRIPSNVRFQLSCPVVATTVVGLPVPAVGPVVMLHHRLLSRQIRGLLLVSLLM